MKLADENPKVTDFARQPRLCPQQPRRRPPPARPGGRGPRRLRPGDRPRGTSRSGRPRRTRSPATTWPLAVRRRGLARRDLGDLAGAVADARRALSLLDALPSRRASSGTRPRVATPRWPVWPVEAGPGVSAAEAAVEADAAMGLLQKAVAMGYRDLAIFRTEAALDPLRDRADFRPADDGPDVPGRAVRPGRVRPRPGRRIPARSNRTGARDRAAAGLRPTIGPRRPRPSGRPRAPLAGRGLGALSFPGGQPKSLGFSRRQPKFLVFFIPVPGTLKQLFVLRSRIKYDAPPIPEISHREAATLNGCFPMHPRSYRIHIARPFLDAANPR